MRKTNRWIHMVDHLHGRQTLLFWSLGVLGYLLAGTVNTVLQREKTK